MKVFRWIMFGLGMIIWFPSFIQCLRSYGGFVDITTKEEWFWASTFLLSCLIVYAFKPSWMSDT